MSSVAAIGGRPFDPPNFQCPGTWRARVAAQSAVMKLGRRKFLHLSARAAVLPAVMRIASAQSYPTRPVRLLVPFPPGGSFDAIARPWADKMKSLLGTVVVEDRKSVV